MPLTTHGTFLGPRKRLYSGHHRKSAQNNGARAPANNEIPPHLTCDLLLPLTSNIVPFGILIKNGWSIYHRPKLSEFYYSPYLSHHSGTKQKKKTPSVPDPLSPLHGTVSPVRPLPTLTSFFARPHNMNALVSVCTF